jgi:hypothetical protein
MPKLQIDYNNTIIYKIVCNDLNITDLYVGHTTQFTKRKNKHKSSCNNVNSKQYNQKVYSTIRENGGWNNWSMIEIEKYNCNDSNEATARERYWYETLESKLNMICPKRSKKECCEINKENYKINKDEIIKRSKDYYIINKDKILKRKKENHEINKVKSKEYYENNKDKEIKRTKEYYENNKDKILKRKKENYENNKDKTKTKL